MQNNNGNGISLDGLEPFEATPSIDFDVTMQRAHEQVGAATGIPADLMGMKPEEQDALYAAVDEVVTPFSEFLRACSERQEELRSVATPRQ